MPKRSEQYKDNPIVLWGHDHSRPAIGKISNLMRKALKAENKKAVTGKVAFDEEDEFAVLIKNKVKNGFLSKGSVGFRSKKVEVMDEPDKDGVWLIHREQELYEFSIVNIPANPNATVLGAEADDQKDADPIDRVIEDIKTMDDLFKELQEYKETLAEILQRIEALEIKEDSTSLYDDIFSEEYREASDTVADQETSDLDYMFSEEDLTDTVEDLLKE